MSARVQPSEQYSGSTDAIAVKISTRSNATRRMVSASIAGCSATASKRADTVESGVLE